MFSWISARTRRKRDAHNFYGSIVALSRAPALYSDYGVPDTVEGRFEILVLHVFAALERLGHENGAQGKLNQDLVNLFFDDMDTTSRELGVGDLTVPKKMRVLAAVFEERMAAYKKAFEDNDPRLLSDEFQQNIFAGDDASQVKAKELVRYAEMLCTRLMDTPIQEFMGDEYNAGRDFWMQ